MHGRGDRRPAALVPSPLPGHRLGRADLAKQAGGGLEIIVIGEGHVPGTVPYSSLLAGHAAQAPGIDPAADLAALPCSSGTTGLSKGVMLTHGNLLASLAVLDSAVHLTEDDVALAVLPLFHIYGLNVLMNPVLSAGATMVTMARFELGAFLRAIEQDRVTALYAVPPIINALARHPADPGLRHDRSQPRGRRHPPRPGRAV